jgi:cell division protein FtsQ
MLNATAKKRQKKSLSKNSVNLPFIGGFHFVTKPIAKMLILLAILIAIWQSKVFWQHYILPIRTIQVIGAVEHVYPHEIKNRLNDYINQSLLFVSLEEAYQRIVAEPWVKNASFKRSWPNQLVVKIEEQQAVAVLNDDLLINTDYQIFSALPKNFNLENLVQVNASAMQVEHVMQMLQAILVEFETKKVTIESLYFSKRGAWELQLSDGTLLKLGRKDVLHRVKRYVALLPVFEKQNKKMVSADLRYDTGLAVQWAHDSSDNRLSGN